MENKVCEILNSITHKLERLEKLEKAIKIYQRVTKINSYNCNGLKRFDLSGIWGSQLSVDEVILLKELENEER